MGTTTVFTRFNDLGLKFEHMAKKDLESLGKLSPYSQEEQFYRGLRASYELHNGNVYVLVFWKGKLIRLMTHQKYLIKNTGINIQVKL